MYGGQRGKTRMVTPVMPFGRTSEATRDKITKLRV